MKRVLNIYYCWDEIGNANSNQNRRQHATLSNMFDSSVLYRKFTQNNYGTGFIGIKSTDWLLLDRLFLKIFSPLKLVWSANIWLWSQKAKKNVTGKYDTILLTGTPYMLFGMARRIAQDNRAKLVVQMYDPLAMNNYVAGAKHFRQKLERKIVKQSDIIIIHSQLMHKLMCEKYPLQASKFKFIPFSSDPDFTTPKTTQLLNEKITLVHAGNLQKERNIDLLIDALEIIPPQTRRKLNIQLVGNTCEKIQRQAQKYECFEFLPFMSRDELYVYYQNADILLAVDSFKDGINIFFPSKLCEYFMFCKPIFLLTPHLSETRRVFAGKAQELCFGEMESTKLANALIALTTDRHCFDNILDYNQNKQFAPINTAQQIATYL